MVRLPSMGPKAAPGARRPPFLIPLLCPLKFCIIFGLNPKGKENRDENKTHDFMERFFFAALRYRLGGHETGAPI
jgi:hypothetical protein